MHSQEKILILQFIPKVTAFQFDKFFYHHHLTRQALNVFWGLWKE